MVGVAIGFAFTAASPAVANTEREWSRATMSLHRDAIRQALASSLAMREISNAIVTIKWKIAEFLAFIFNYIHLFVAGTSGNTWILHLLTYIIWLTCSQFLSPKQTSPMEQQLQTLSSKPTWLLFLSSIGLIVFLKHFTTLLKWVFHSFFRPPKNLRNYGGWALITGATDGIGKSFAHQLAGEGLNLILVSRSFDKLRTVSDEIHTHFPNTRVKTIVLDFTQDIAVGVQKIKEVTRDLDVGILINNVGITYRKASFFHEVDETVWMNVVKVNLAGTTIVTRALLPLMLARKKGAIVNIGSGAGSVLPSHPLYTVYAATKAYVDQFSRCLHVEYKNHGIDVQCQVPLYVATKMVSKVASVEGPSLFIPTADAYAKSAIHRIGFESHCIPYWSHALQSVFVGLLPEAILDASRLTVGLQRREKQVT